ncbi:uncharacterized protein LOC125596767 [Brassica napus]|uniref:uncharacterized protein LOC125596767 n=1 Tax=Brassica napus TaxID=3708 RepID=UPI0020785F3F|nr:uncharacterized protein LOC125596767 [Brassica napus]
MVELCTTVTPDEWNRGGEVITKQMGEGKWIQENHGTLGIIQRSLSSSTLEADGHEGTAKELWESMEAVYEDRSHLCKVLWKILTEEVLPDVESVCGLVKHEQAKMQPDKRRKITELEQVITGKSLYSAYIGDIKDGDSLTNRHEKGGADEVITRREWDAFVAKAKALTASKKQGSHSVRSKPIIVDSGASHHMISDRSLMDEVRAATGNVQIANGDKIPIEGIGSLKLFDRESTALYLPQFTSNLISVKRATIDLQCQVVFRPQEVEFQDLVTGQVIGKGSSTNNLYQLQSTKLSKPSISICMSSTADGYEKSKYTWVTLLPSKDRVLEAFINFQAYVTNHYNATVKVLRSDNGVVSACYLINRTPTKVLRDLSPFEVLNKARPQIQHLRKGYKCYDPVTGRVLVSRDVKFIEGKGYYEEKIWEDLKDLPQTPSDKATNLRKILENLGISMTQDQGTRREPPRSTSTHEEESERRSPLDHEGGSEAESGVQQQQKSDSGSHDQGETQGEENPRSDGDAQADRESPRSDGDAQTDRDEQAAMQNPVESVGIQEPETEVQPLRRSTRVKKDPSNWVNTRIYYNAEAVAHPTQAVCSFATYPEEHVVFMGNLDENEIPSFKLSPCRLKQEEAVCSIRLFNTSRGRRVHPGVQKLSAAVSHHPMSPLKKEDPRKQRQWSGLATLSNKASSGFLLFKVQEEVSQEESLLLVLVWRVQHGERWELRHGGSKGKVHGRWRRWSAH